MYYTHTFQTHFTHTYTHTHTHTQLLFPNPFDLASNQFSGLSGRSLSRPEFDLRRIESKHSAASMTKMNGVDLTQMTQKKKRLLLPLFDM